jgi:hypothetical protein
MINGALALHARHGKHSSAGSKICRGWMVVAVARRININRLCRVLLMPRLDGLGFCADCRSITDRRETPVAIVSGDSFVEDTRVGGIGSARRRAQRTSRSGSKTWSA